ncbi:MULTISPECIES: hypothetical protein [Paenibacillus]|nr:MULTISPECIES: hypothetical protein [Paenibacillus]
MAYLEHSRYPVAIDERYILGLEKKKTAPSAVSGYLLQDGLRHALFDH